MKRILVIGLLAALVCSAAGAAWMFMRRDPEWTTSSSAALEEFRKGLDAEMKLYHPEAGAHFRRALELDPNFLMARFKLAGHDPSLVPSIREQLKKVDISTLSEREQFIVRYYTALTEEKKEEADRIVDAYLANHPQDPVALSLRCEDEWNRQSWDKARTCYERLIKADPNWVIAQNHLGYIAMAQGRFAEAEELFRTYRYIAPDQANPHDSLGELLMLVGRHEEARRELREALRIRPDFCASWGHLVSAYVLEGNMEGARQALAEAEQGGQCRERDLQGIRCSVMTMEKAYASDWPGLLVISQENDCVGAAGDATVLTHRAAVKTGDVTTASMIEEMAGERASSRRAGRTLKATTAHMRGVRLASERKYAQAIEELKKADEMLVFWGDGEGLFKLYNRVTMAATWRAAGNRAAADALVAEVERISPGFVEGVKAVQ